MNLLKHPHTIICTFPLITLMCIFFVICKLILVKFSFQLVPSYGQQFYTFPYIYCFSAYCCLRSITVMPVTAALGRPGWRAPRAHCPGCPQHAQCAGPCASSSSRDPRGRVILPTVRISALMVQKQMWGKPLVKGQWHGIYWYSQFALYSRLNKNSFTCCSS